MTGRRQVEDRQNPQNKGYHQYYLSEHKNTHTHTHTQPRATHAAGVVVVTYMSTPVVTDKWAGAFDCSICRRKRLVGAEFSKTALEKYRKNGGALKCKKCVANKEAAERKAAEAKREANKCETATTVGSNGGSFVCCSACKLSLPERSFNRNQLSKAEKARCKQCVERSIQEESKMVEDAKADKINAAKSKLKSAEARGNTAEIAKAASELSALEAEHVTGLKPMILGKGRGRTAGRGRGRRR
mmetsp:Transcript_26380/g.40841  ORF Transcript_26380/g.40841 Transcript_26380/m.40841 type:complete len:243 (-) Transcript_26380:113-841(-)